MYPGSLSVSLDAITAIAVASCLGLAVLEIWTRIIWSIKPTKQDFNTCKLFAVVGRYRHAYVDMTIEHVSARSVQGLLESLADLYRSQVLKSQRYSAISQRKSQTLGRYTIKRKSL